MLWLITLFTIGHTLTLILAAYNLVNINSDYIEFAIPVTILITAVVNLFYAKNASKTTKTNTNLIFALFFGLIHGFGFSTYFRMLIGTSDNKMVSLLEFALGIEIAQIIVVLFILALGFIMQTFFRFSKRDWVMIVSSIVIGVVLPILRDTKFW